MAGSLTERPTARQEAGVEFRRSEVGKGGVHQDLLPRDDANAMLAALAPPPPKA